MTDTNPSSKNQLIAIEMRPTSAEKTELTVRFNRPFTTAEMNAMHRGLNLHLVGAPDETTPVPAARRYRWSAEGMILDDTGPWASGEMVRRAVEPPVVHMCVDDQPHSGRRADCAVCTLKGRPGEK